MAEMGYYLREAQDIIYLCVTKMKHTTDVVIKASIISEIVETNLILPKPSKQPKLLFFGPPLLTSSCWTL
jgi:hypothetical protein